MTFLIFLLINDSGLCAAVSQHESMVRVAVNGRLESVFNYSGMMVCYYVLSNVIDTATGKKPAIGDLNGNGIPAVW
jgi:hypothetical protein